VKVLGHLDAETGSAKVQMPWIPDRVRDDGQDKAQGMYFLGVSYNWSKEFMPFMTYEHRDFEDRKAKDYNRFQLKF
jgi:hypothetical protein